MNIKPVVRYQSALNFHIFKTMYSIFYGLVVFFFILSLVRPSMHSNVSGLEMVTMITTFIIGITTVRHSLRFFVSNGVTRRRFLLGALASFGIAAAATAALDTVNAAVFRFLLGANFSTVYSMVRFPKGGTDPAVLSAPYLVQGFFWRFFLYLTLALCGACIRALYLRLSRTVKVVVSAGVPALLFVGLPMLDSYAGGHISAAFSVAFDAWIRLSTQPVPDAAIHIALSAVLAAILFLLLHRAEIMD